MSTPAQSSPNASVAMSIVGEADDARDVMNLSESATPERKIMEEYSTAGLVVTNPAALDELIGSKTESPVGSDSSRNFAPVHCVSITPTIINPKSSVSSPSDQLPATPCPIERSLARTSGNKHIAFTDNTSLADETPFNTTLKYFKGIKDKENSTTRARRYASLPEEIAELAKEFNEFSDDSDLDQYRDEDLALMDTVLENNIAGDIMMPATTIFNIRNEPKIEEEASEVYAAPPKPVIYELKVPGHNGDVFGMKIETSASVEEVARFIREKGRELEANSDVVDKAVQDFIAAPELFIVHKRNEGLDQDSNFDGESEKAKVIEDVEHPIFIKVIGLIPMAMLSAVAQPIAFCADKTVEMVVEKLAGLTIRDKS
ncbi:hypothetical protein CC78DRAFT_596098 [Lojkania enalia]|uniref:Uncharacterized protein n=1 Tax=Lojkania enalia TaxID=147567 RepID=A0A9P4TRE4_9PLEO|nr:hypothetical protein CC78DRAFT_596098 [Didymosphaeria enalia]